MITAPRTTVVIDHVFIEILNILKEKDSLSDKLKALISDAKTLRVLEDIYEPYKGSKNSRADDAVKNGLTPLANMISSVKYSIEDIKSKAKSF